MKNLSQMKTAAANSGQAEAKVVLEWILDLEASDDSNDDLTRASLEELIGWAQSFHNSIGAT